MINIGKLKCYHIEFLPNQIHDHHISFYRYSIFINVFWKKFWTYFARFNYLYLEFLYKHKQIFKKILFCKFLLAAYGNMIDILLSIVASAALLNLSALFIDWWLLQIMTTLQIVSIFQLMNFYFIFKNFARVLSSSLMFKMISVHLLKQSYWSYFAVYSTYHLFYKFDWFLKHQPNLHTYMSLGCDMVRYLKYH